MFIMKTYWELHKTRGLGAVFETLPFCLLTVISNTKLFSTTVNPLPE